MTELAAHVRYLVCQPTFQLTKLTLRAFLLHTWVGYIFYFPSRWFPAEPVIRMVILVAAKLSLNLVHCLKKKKNTVLFSLSHCIFCIPKGCLNLGEKRRLFKSLFSNRKKYHFFFFKSSLTPLDWYYLKIQVFLISKQPVLNVLRPRSLQNHHILFL